MAHLPDGWLHGRPIVQLDLPHRGYVRVLHLDQPILDECGRTCYRITTEAVEEFVSVDVMATWRSAYDPDAIGRALVDTWRGTGCAPLATVNRVLYLRAQGVYMLVEEITGTVDDALLQAAGRRT